MSAKLIATVVFNYLGEGLAPNMPKKEFDKMHRFWKVLEQRRGFDFFYEVVQEVSAMYKAKHGVEI